MAEMLQTVHIHRQEEMSVEESAVLGSKTLWPFEEIHISSHCFM